MPDMKIFDKSMVLLQKVLDLRLQNQQVIASNIANADTPGYSPVHLEFEEELQKAAAIPEKSPVKTHNTHFPINGGNLESVQAKLVRTPSKSGIGDGNSVKVNQEMVSLAENQLLYEAAVQILNKKLGLLKYVSQGGR